ncbi:MAG: hypothetical protein U1E39_15320 [Planctomycetota bacterium]
MPRWPLPVRPRAALRRSGPGLAVRTDVSVPAGLAVRRALAALVVAVAAVVGARSVLAGDAPATAPPAPAARVPADATPFSLSEAHEDLDGEARAPTPRRWRSPSGRPAAPPTCRRGARVDGPRGPRRLVRRGCRPSRSARRRRRSGRRTACGGRRATSRWRARGAAAAGRQTVERRWGERARDDLERACATRDRDRLRDVAGARR